MKRETDKQTEWGLLATGSSRKWAIDVDESLDGHEWTLEIDGPQAYLVFQLRDLKVIPKTLGFLQSGPPSNASEGGDGEAAGSELILGRFGSASVSLVWDNEDLPRCFLIIGPKAPSTLRLTLWAEDIQMLSEALRQVMQDLPQAAIQEERVT